MMTRLLYIAKKKEKKEEAALIQPRQPASAEVLHFTSGSSAVGDGSVYHPVLAAKYTVIKLAVCISLFFLFYLFLLFFFRLQTVMRSNLQASCGPTTEELSAANYRRQ